MGLPVAVAMNDALAPTLIESFAGLLWITGAVSTFNEAGEVVVEPTVLVKTASNSSPLSAVVRPLMVRVPVPLPPIVAPAKRPLLKSEKEPPVLYSHWIPVMA